MNTILHLALVTGIIMLQASGLLSRSFAINLLPLALAECKNIEQAKAISMTVTGADEKTLSIG